MDYKNENLNNNQYKGFLKYLQLCHYKNTVKFNENYAYKVTFCGKSITSFFIWNVLIKVM